MSAVENHDKVARGDATDIAEGPPDRRGGGTGNAGGVDLHAMGMVAAAVNLMRGTKVGWLVRVVEDIPVAITAETGGPGDDIGLELADGTRVEIQSKKNLSSGDELWTALEALVDGVSRGEISYGVLLVGTDSSGTIREDLAEDIVRIGQGAEGHFSEIGRKWLDRLKKSGRSPAACASIRIVALHIFESQSADCRTILEVLRSICADRGDADAALGHLYSDAIALQKSRGRWTLPSLVRLLRSRGIALSEDDTPAGVTSKLATWVERTNGEFSLPAGKQMIPIAEMLPMSLAAIPREQPDDADASAALERYHSRGGETLGNLVYDGEWIGRFRQLNVMVAGPGLGKSTLSKRLAWEYARDGLPVLSVSLKRVASAMGKGSPFDQALEDHALDGSGITKSRLRTARLGRMTVIADGLDEAGELHEDVADGLVKFAVGHPEATIIVTTRPVGYDTAKLARWRHYRVEGPGQKEDERNLGRLIALGSGLDPDDANAHRAAKRELTRTPARDVIGASPLLLGMSATLIIRNERLPDTRPKLYEAMIALFENRDTVPSDLTQREAARVLDIVGWELMKEPNREWPRLQQAACRYLAADLGGTELAADRVFAAGFAHWERAGIVERIYFGGTQLVTFVHKTFGEFAASRFLISMGNGRLDEMERIVDVPELGEVVSFAGALGLGNDLAQMFVNRRDRGAAGQFERALALAGDRDAKVDTKKVEELATIGFAIVASGSEDRFSIGVALAELARARHDILIPIARARFEDDDDTVRLVAWACALEAGDDQLDRSQLAAVFDNLAGRITPPEPPGKPGIRAVRSDKDIDLVHIVALAALAAQPPEEMADFAASRLSGSPFNGYKFYMRLKSILAANGVEKPVFAWERSPKSLASMSGVLGPDDYWNRAANRATRALAEAMCGDASVRPAVLGQRFAQFSALYELAGIASADAIDVHKWTPDHDKVAVADTIRALVALSRIDSGVLAQEAAAIMDILDASPARSAFLGELGTPDIPEPDWASAETLQLDRGRVETAFHHGSSWLMIIAANLLANFPADEEDHIRLLAQSRGVELFYASQIIAEQAGVELWRDLILGRAASGSAEGTEHLLEALSKSVVHLPPEAGVAITIGLKSDIAALVAAAASLGVKWLAAGGTVDTDLAVAAYHASLGLERDKKDDHWHPHGQARAAVLNLMIAHGSLDEGLLQLALSDPQAEPRKVAEDEAARRDVQSA